MSVLFISFTTSRTEDTSVPNSAPSASRDPCLAQDEDTLTLLRVGFRIKDVGKVSVFSQGHPLLALAFPKPYEVSACQGCMLTNPAGCSQHQYHDGVTDVMCSQQEILPINGMESEHRLCCFAVLLLENLSSM